MEMSLERAITERVPLSLLKAILEGGADVNAPSSSPPLLLSLACAHEEAALLLLKHGADPHVRVDGKYPLLAAAEAGMQKVVKELIARGVSPLPPEGDSVSAFPFVVACRLGHYHVCELLLRKATHGVPTGSRAARARRPPGLARRGGGHPLHLRGEICAVVLPAAHLPLPDPPQDDAGVPGGAAPAHGRDQEDIGGANRTVKLRAAAKREIFRTAPVSSRCAPTAAWVARRRGGRRSARRGPAGLSCRAPLMGFDSEAERHRGDGGAGRSRR